MKSCCDSIIKYFIFLFNFIFAIIGVAIVGLGLPSGLGAYVYNEVRSFLDLQNTSYVNAPIFLIFIGFIIFAISFFGCCGSFLENKCMIYIYAAFLIAILFAEVFIGISVYILFPEIAKDVNMSMVNYGKPGYEDATKSWDLLQTKLFCCGVTNYTDWQHNLPASCCDVTLPSCNINNDVNLPFCNINIDVTKPSCNINIDVTKPSCNIRNVHGEGCLDKVKAMGATVGIVLALLQLVIIISSCRIGHRIGARRHALRQRGIGERTALSKDF